MVFGGVTTAQRQVRCLAGFGGVARKGAVVVVVEVKAVATAKVPQHCRDGKRLRADGGRAALLRWCWLRGEITEVAGMPLRCWGRERWQVCCDIVGVVFLT
jgi:hypothetical protein